MAAFDPIEFFGIGHGRDIAIPRHTRAGSQDSISLSSPEPTSHATLPTSDSEQPWLAQFQSRPILKEPEPSFHRTFADITPESSVYIPASSVGVPLIESPNVSVNSSWASNLDRPFSIGRYVSNHERHETILLSLSAAPRRPIPPIPDVSNTLPPSNKPGTEERLGPFEIESAEKGIPNDSSLHRYLTDIQPHELLSVALEQKSHHPSERKAQRPHQDSQKTDASISLSATLSGGEQLEQVDVIPSPTEVMRRSREIQQQRAAGHPRLYKIKRLRCNESPPEGHRDKMARRR